MFAAGSLLHAQHADGVDVPLPFAGADAVAGGKSDGPTVVVAEVEHEAANARVTWQPARARYHGGAREAGAAVIFCRHVRRVQLQAALVHDNAMAYHRHRLAWRCSGDVLTGKTSGRTPTLLHTACAGGSTYPRAASNISPADTLKLPPTRCAEAAC